MPHTFTHACTVCNAHMPDFQLRQLLTSIDNGRLEPCVCAFLHQIQIHTKLVKSIVLCTIRSAAVLHYMSQYSFCWDSVGMDIKDLESVGMDPNRSAPLRASTSPPPPLAYFQHIKLSVPKRKIWFKLNLTIYNSICTFCHYGHAEK